MTTIAVLSGVNLDSKNVERFGISYFTRICRVVFYDARQILGRSTIFDNLDRSFHGAELIELTNISQFREVLSQDNPLFVLDFVGDCPQRKELRKACKDIGVIFVHQSTGNFPTIPISKKIAFEAALVLDQPFSISKLLNIGSFAKQVLSRLARRLFANFRRTGDKLIPPDIALLSGKAAVNEWNSRSGKIIWVPSQDTEKFWRWRAEFTLSQSLKDKIIFIDDDLPNSRDNALCGLKSVSPGKYYASMNKFFSFLEKKLGSEVIIASRDTANTSNQSASYDNRLCIKGKTLELVCNSTATIVHASTAVSYAILSRRPILVITLNALFSDPYQISISALAHSLGKSVLNINNIKHDKIINELRVDDLKWKEYEERYLSYKANGSKIWDSLVSEFTDLRKD